MMDLDSTCPFCGETNDAMSAVEGDDRMPEPGNVSICAECFEPSLFGDDLSLREPAADEFQRMMADDDLRALYAGLIGRAEVLPCGCRLWREVHDIDGEWAKVFVYRACRPGCENVAVTLQMADDADLEVEIVEVPE